MAYNSDIPKIEAQRQADRIATNAGSIVPTWAGRQARWELEQRQKRDAFPVAPPSFPTSPPIGNITFNPSETPSKTSFSSQGTSAADSPVESWAIVGAVIAVIFGLMQGLSLEGLIGWAIVGALGGAAAALVFIVMIAILAFCVQLAVWGFVILFILNLFT